jgi:phosphate starvation-inducible membrane PsiE
LVEGPDERLTPRQNGRLTVGRKLTLTSTSQRQGLALVATHPSTQSILNFFLLTLISVDQKLTYHLRLELKSRMVVLYFKSTTHLWHITSLATGTNVLVHLLTQHREEQETFISIHNIDAIQCSPQLTSK